jgi:phosphomevalonate kinase
MVSIEEKYFILIHGQMKTGKTTLANAIAGIYKGARVFHLADQLKEDYCAKNSLSLEELESDKASHRKALIDYGSEMREKSEGMHWIKIAEDRIRYTYHPVVIIPDIRFENELTYFQKKYNTISIKLEATKELLKERGANMELLSDASEQGIDENLFNIRQRQFVIDDNMNRSVSAILSYNIILPTENDNPLTIYRKMDDTTSMVNIMALNLKKLGSHSVLITSYL